MSSRRFAASWVVLGLVTAGCASEPSFEDDRPPTTPAPPLNHPPVLTPLSVTTDGSLPIVVDLLQGASDPDGDPLSLTFASSGEAIVDVLQDHRRAQVVPLAGYPVHVHYTVEDGHAHHANGELVIELAAAEHAPIATADQLGVIADMPRLFHLQGSDPDSQPLTYTIVTAPAHGTLGGIAPDLVYTPDAGFRGTDQLVFSVSDGTLTSATAIVVFVVMRDNHAPVATPQAVAVTEDSAKVITLTGSDQDGDALSFVLQDAPSHGTLSGAAPAVTYTPASNYNGFDSFSFVVRDAFGTTSPAATVSINVTGSEDAPVGTTPDKSVNEDQATAILLTGSDLDGDALTFAIVTAPAHGTFTGTPPNLSYTPAANYNGPDSFAYTVSDGTLTSSAITVQLTVKPVNDAPIAIDGTAETDEDVPVDLTLQASDVDSTALTYSVLSFPADGTLTGNGSGALTYTPAPNVNGTRTFTFKASDGQAGSNVATVTITIHPTNDAPTAADDYAATDPGQAVTFDVLANDGDLDGDALTISAPGTPAHGTAEVVAGKLRYTPAAGFTGIDVFAYTARDPSGATATANVHVGVGTFPPGAPLETLLALAVDPSDARNAPSQSADGRFVAFTAAAALIADDTNGVSDVYLYDRGDRSVTRVSQASTGTEANGASRNAHISADGRFIVFESIASTLVPGDSNATLDVFRHDRITGETVRVSVASSGAQASGASTEPKISDDGSRVVFTSTAFDLVANDANGTADIFVRDLVAGTTTRISTSTAGGEGDLAASAPAISGDGRLVAFTSNATNLTPGDSNNASDIFVRDLVAATTTRVSVSSTGGEANGVSLRASISQDGRFVSFLSTATNLVSGGSGTQVYVRDTQAQTTTKPVPSSSMSWARLSGDGRYLATMDSSGVKICDRFAAVITQPVGASAWRFPTWSRDGRYLTVIASLLGDPLIVTPNPL